MPGYLYTYHYQYQSHWSNTQQYQRFEANRPVQLRFGAAARPPLHC
jgi:hypothetical protein